MHRHPRRIRHLLPLQKHHNQQKIQPLPLLHNLEYLLYKQTVERLYHSYPICISQHHLHNFLLVVYNLAYTIICQILNSDIRPNAFFAVSDILAAAAINACNRFHLRVPEDVMVMGFDNVDICTMIRPSITTVSQPKFQLGYTASEILIDLLHNSNTNARNLLLSTELIIRESATSLGNEIASPTSKT